MTFKKGDPRPANGGRKTGTPNVVTRDLRVMILNALERCGNEDWLQELAETNSGAFAALLKGILPKPIEISGPEGGAIENKVTVEFVHTEKK